MIYSIWGPAPIYFINKYRILVNKGHLLFTDHQKFWKFIKNPSQKVKKCEIFSRFWKFLQHFQKFRKFKWEILLKFLQNFGNFENFGKSSFFQWIVPLHRMWCSWLYRRWEVTGNGEVQSNIWQIVNQMTVFLFHFGRVRLWST